ncbi:MAG: hypothetical protein AB1742_10050 [bacterium]
MGFIPALGRLLTACCRDPRLTGGIPARDDLFRDYLKSSSLNSGEFLEFLAKENISRVEIDNTTQFYNFKPPSSLKVSLHFPYVYSSTTRRCLYAHVFPENKPRTLGVNPCGKECLEGTITFKMPGCGHTMLVRGNTQFYENRVLPENRTLKRFHIDRIVHHDVPLPRKIPGDGNANG